MGTHDGDEAKLLRWVWTVSVEQQLDSSVWQASKQKSDLFSRFGAAQLLYTVCAWLGIPVA